jgi:hypothetical protein
MGTNTSVIPPGTDPNSDFRFYIAWYSNHTTRLWCSTSLPISQPFIVDRRKRMGGGGAGESDALRFWGKGTWHHDTSWSIGYSRQWYEWKSWQQHCMAHILGFDCANGVKTKQAVRENPVSTQICRTSQTLNKQYTQPITPDIRGGFLQSISDRKGNRQPLGMPRCYKWSLVICG